MYREGMEKRVIEYTLTDETPDRYGDVVLAKGAKFDNYKKNPIVLLFHDYSKLPVGNIIKVWTDKENKCVKGLVLFFNNEIDDTGMSETAFKFASNGAMKAGSIGFMPIKGCRPDEKQVEEYDMPSYGYLWEEWELLEFSLVPVPANPNALKNHFKKIDEEMVKRSWCELKERIKKFEEKSGKPNEENGIINNMNELIERLDKIEQKIAESAKNINILATAVNCLNVSMDEIVSRSIEEQQAMGSEEPKFTVDDIEKSISAIDRVNNDIKNLEV